MKREAQHGLLMTAQGLRGAALVQMPERDGRVVAAGR